MRDDFRVEDVQSVVRENPYLLNAFFPEAYIKEVAAKAVEVEAIRNLTKAIESLNITLLVLSDIVRGTPR